MDFIYNLWRARSRHLQRL